MAIKCCSCGFGSELSEDFRSWSDLEDSADFYPITSNGKPTGRVTAWLCARCLKNARSMRDHVKSIQSGLRVTKHAIERFLERQSGEPISEEAATATIIKQFGKSKPIRFRQEHMIQRLLNHGNPADYFFHAGTIFVATQESPRAILTVERQWHRKLGRDFWFLNS